MDKVSNLLAQLSEKLISFCFYSYIDFVYKTSKVNLVGQAEFFKSDYPEKFVFFIWHGDSYCFYPLLKGERLNIVTTKNKRGGVISRISQAFGYDVIRLPDYSENGDYIFKLRSKINSGGNSNLVVSADGPLGPYHEPKEFAFIMALFSRRRIVPVNIEVKRKIELKNRWDKLKFPLPFNQINVSVSQPIKLSKADRKDRFAAARDKIKSVMD
ncbi:hypothetical protein [Halanaerobium salsuginis]|jgi:hypothetical protein|uniref:DUF374 domain-containing protein n=1 Tax=Halanaerobium salsuginis TaxID=29563 RepID=A0A1I4JQU1_9FIRM|nr:hypothetical protein [Halanaerobium salsuginis]SFL68844.1 hypothetical protein SAMN02983006_01787 [Halanaerobium salsuginis]